MMNFFSPTYYFGRIAHVLICSILCCTFFVSKTQAQVQNALINHGKISYEVKVNTHKQMQRDGDNAWFERMKDKIPKYKVTNYELEFIQNESLYKKSKIQPEVDGSVPLWLKNDDEVSNIYKNNTTNQIVHQKTIMDKLFLIQDTMMTYKWIMGNEFRIIAGYNCRRVSTVIMDSIYVIAFYTDAIMSSCSPLSLRGLPGAVLGVVIPRMNQTIFATKVEAFGKEKATCEIPVKGEKINYQKAIELIKSKSSNSWMKKNIPEMIWNLRL